MKGTEGVHVNYRYKIIKLIDLATLLNSKIGHFKGNKIKLKIRHLNKNGGRIALEFVNYENTSSKFTCT